MTHLTPEQLAKEMERLIIAGAPQEKMAAAIRKNEQLVVNAALSEVSRAVCEIDLEEIHKLAKPLASLYPRMGAQIAGARALQAAADLVKSWRRG